VKVSTVSCVKAASMVLPRILLDLSQQKRSKVSERKRTDYVIRLCPLILFFKINYLVLLNHF